jgi:hypothetical protein
VFPSLDVVHHWDFDQSKMKPIVSIALSRNDDLIAIIIPRARPVLHPQAIIVENPAPAKKAWFPWFCQPPPAARYGRPFHVLVTYPRTIRRLSFNGPKVYLQSTDLRISEGHTDGVWPVPMFIREIYETGRLASFDL